ncbi:hypothetical protein [Paenibacillus sp. LHD-38]|uniref:hypothetical protein n=1 Tax=Paenibacillus sp. LHD-38 TaxID=3072143 RepID=UPI00280CA6E2|nr:hypothetical protein [Paenibacillus sp. LHD-38]MDQ8736975.1 hypothetical protein [Paenibacillus sp. LHD-38]
MGIKYAFSRPTSTLEDEYTMIKGYRQAGYDGLQLKWSQYTPYIKEPERFIERWGQPDGIASALITGGTLLDDESKAQLRELFRFAGKVGTEIIVYCHSVSRKSITYEHIARYAGIFEEMGKEAQQHGLQLSLHHHYDQPLMYRIDFDVFFDQLQADSAVGLTVDTAHLVKSGIEDAAEVIRTFAPFINNFLDGIRPMANSEAESVYCSAYSSNAVDCIGETDATVQMTFANGVSTHFTQSFSSPFIKNDLVVLGSEGVISSNSDVIGLYRLDPSGVPNWNPTPVQTWQAVMPIDEAVFDGLDQLLVWIETGIEAANSARDNLHSVSLLDSAYISAKENRVVSLSNGLL